MLINFSYTCCSSVFFWEVSIWVPSSFLKWLFAYCSFLFILNVNTLSDTWFAKDWNWTLILCHTQNQLKMNYCPIYEIWNHRTPRRKPQEEAPGQWPWQWCFDVIPKAKALNPNISRWKYMKIKSLCTAKETINEMKRQPMEWEKTLVKIFWVDRL